MKLYLKGSTSSTMSEHGSNRWRKTKKEDIFPRNYIAKPESSQKSSKNKQGREENLYGL